MFNELITHHTLVAFEVIFHFNALRKSMLKKLIKGEKNPQQAMSESPVKKKSVSEAS